jgi:hypothetical protein
MKSLLIIFTSILLFSFTGDTVTDYLSIKGPLKYNQTNFDLKWSDRPNDKYYIQEYLPKGESLNDFNQMITIHLFDTNIKLKEAVNQKAKELDKRKETDAVCNYQIIDSPDGKEFIVDFLISESKDDKMTIAEFNVYHYRQIELDKKHKAIAVYAYSKRSYGDDITGFLKTLKNERNIHLNEMISLKKPLIKLKQQ